MLFRLLTFASAVLLLKTSLQFINEIVRCNIPDLCFCNPELSYSKVEEEVC